MSRGRTPLPSSILRAVQAEGGRVTFARFMQLALTDPESGYYSRAERVLGEGGDFTTAPRKVPAFSRAVARLLADIVEAADRPVLVVEVGGGEGDLAAGVLGQWAEMWPHLRARASYRLLDVAESLRRRQREAVEPFRARGWDVSTATLAQTAGEMRAGRGCYAVILSNELLDALPVHVVDVAGVAPREAWVHLVPAAGGGWHAVETFAELSPEGLAEMLCLFGMRDAAKLRLLSRDGRLELRPAVGDLLGEWVRAFPEVCVVTFDYGEWLPGNGGHEVGNARRARHGETRRGYYRHLLTKDPFRLVGRQDLTADVDFRALDVHGRALGLETVLFTPLATFLRAGGGGDELARLAQEAQRSLEADAAHAVLAALLDEDGLGGSFKLMVQVTR